jgi:spore coat protein U-like protein
MKMKLLYAAAAGALLSITPAHAGTATGQVDMRLGVVTSCTVIGAGSLIDFGNVPAEDLTGLNIDADTTAGGGTGFQVDCNGSSLSAVLTFGSGLNDVGSERFMADAAGLKIPYGLYLDQGRVKLAFPGRAEAVALVDGNNNFDFYARIPSGTVLPVGSYADIIPLTLTF